MVWRTPVRPFESYDSIQRAIVTKLWQVGDLTYKLDPLQKQTYDEIRSFFDSCSNSFERLWVNEWSRRLGKDFMTLVFIREEMIKNHGHIYHYGTAFERDLTRILMPMIERIEADCPEEYRLHSKSSKGMYIDPITGSELRLVGLDKNPNGIRGNRGDGIVVTEYSYCNKIDESETAFSPMLVENEHAWRIYNSTPGPSTAHKWHTAMVPRARRMGSYSFRILDECPRFREGQIEAAYDEFGGRDTTKSRREYRCEHVGETEALVVPEWIEARGVCLVDRYDRPTHAHCYVGMDPGMIDLTGVVAGYYDFKNDILVFERAVAKRRLNTEQVAEEIKKIERPWEKFGYFDSSARAHKNPYRRICDRDLRLIADLNESFGISFDATAKQDLHAAINMFRTRVQQHRIRILPDARELALHLDAAIWNDKRTQLEHVTAEFGHFDLLMAAVYLHRNLDISTNPFSPLTTYPANYHVPYPATLPKSGWTYQRNERGEVAK